MEWKRIESRANPAIKFAASLADKKARDREGVFAAEGFTLFFDFCQRGYFPEAIYLADSAAALRPRIEQSPAGHTAQLYSLSDAAFEKISTEKGAQGLLCTYSVSALSRLVPLSRVDRLVALERVQDPGNVGTVIRTAASFGFDGVLLVDAADPFGPKTVRATMGALAKIPVVSFPSTEALLAFLRERGVRTVAACLCETAKPIEETSLSAPVCIMIGNEGKGLSEIATSGADCASIIPMEGMESLNAAVAASIYLWEVKRRSKLEG